MGSKRISDEEINRIIELINSRNLITAKQLLIGLKNDEEETNKSSLRKKGAS